MITTRRQSALAMVLVLGASGVARAQDVTPTFHLEGGADVMLTDTYRDRFDWGGHGVLRAGLEVLGPLAVQVGFATSWFPVSGQEPGNLYAIELGVRAFFRVADDAVGGPFVDANGGAGITGDVVRFTFDVGLGWDFFPHPAFGIGPVVRYLQIVQPDGEPVADDAYMIAFGLNLTARIDLGGAPASEEEPETDADGDGVPDSRDRCAAEAEDVDGFADDDGCPDADNDSDGIDDAIDRCPNAAEVRNGIDDEDGCPDEAPPPAPVAGEPEPELLQETVLFRLGSDRVSPRYREPIAAVCALLAAQPEVRVRVVGHADEQGTAAANHRLGASRAGAVAEQLVLCGVAPTRIESTSYGDTRRLCTDENEECRMRNRRVMFELLRP